MPAKRSHPTASRDGKDEAGGKEPSAKKAKAEYRDREWAGTTQQVLEELNALRSMLGLMPELCNIIAGYAPPWPMRFDVNASDCKRCSVSRPGHLKYPLAHDYVEGKSVWLRLTMLAACGSAALNEARTCLLLPAVGLYTIGSEHPIRESVRRWQLRVERDTEDAFIWRKVHHVNIIREERKTFIRLSCIRLELSGALPRTPPRDPGVYFSATDTFDVVPPRGNRMTLTIVVMNDKACLMVDGGSSVAQFAYDIDSTFYFEFAAGLEPVLFSFDPDLSFEQIYST